MTFETTTPAYNVTEELRDELPTATVRVMTTMNSIPDDLGRIYHQVFRYLAGTDIRPTGAPFAWYHRMSEDEIDMEAGVPVDKPIDGDDQVKPSSLPGGSVAVVWYSGPYGDEMAPAYEAIEQWISNNGFESVDGPWEVYWTDPAETSPEDYRTEIVWPIRKQN